MRLALALLARSPALAAATEPPVPLEVALDMARWEAAGRVLLDGPPGCVEVRGEARVDMRLYQPGGWLGPGETRRLQTGGPFEGRLEDGRWTRLITSWEQPEGEALFHDQDDGDELDSELFLVVGRTGDFTDRGKPPPPEGEGDGEVEGEVSISVGGDGTQVAVAEGGGQALGIIDQIIDDLDADVDLSYSGWDPDRQAVILHQVVPMKGTGGDVFQVVTEFPGGGPPTRLEATFPPRARVEAEGMPFKVTVLNGQLHVRGLQTELGVVPLEEGGSVVVGLLGWTVGIDQHVRYTAVRRCPLESTEDAAPEL